MTRRRRRPERDEQNPVGLSGWLYTDLLLGLMVVFLATVSVMNLSGGGNDEDSAGASATTTTTTTPEEVELLAQVEALGSQLAEAKTENREFSAENSGLQSTVEDLSGSLATASAENSGLQSTVEDLSGSLATASAENSGLQSTVEDLEVSLSVAVAEASRAKIPLGVEKGYVCFRINERIEVGPHGSDSVDLLVDRVNEELVKAGLKSRYAGIVLTFSVSEDSEKWRAIRDAEAFNDDVLTQIPMFERAATRAYHDGRPRTGVKSETSGIVFDKVDGGFMLEIHLLDDGKDPPPLGVDDNPDCG